MISNKFPNLSTPKGIQNGFNNEQKDDLKTPTRVEFSKLKYNYGKFMDSISQASTSGAVEYYFL
jgi:hypothetical protein